MAISENTWVVLSGQFRIQWEEAQQCYVLLYPEGMVQLNPSAGEILSRCQQQTTIADVISDLQNSFAETDPKALAADVVEFIHEANDQGWLDLKN